MIILTTLATEDEATRIGQTLVRDKLAACVQISSPIKSIYKWEGKIEEQAEVQLWIKTSAQASLKAVERLKSLHSYQVPEILILPVSGGHQEYLSWILAETQS